MDISTYITSMCLSILSGKSFVRKMEEKKNKGEKEKEKERKKKWK